MSSYPANLPRYDVNQTYDWNYERPLDPLELAVPALPGSWQFCGLPVASPLGIAAGPLLNGRWILYYASLGFDLLTYKTVRSAARACYPLPNLQPVRCGELTGREPSVLAADDMQGSWAVSFGMPSKAPDVWRADVEATRHRLPPGKLLSVSVVGTIQAGWRIDDLAGDYAQCARWAVESGADAVEANFSCPNVATCDGQLYQQPADAAIVAQAVREAIGRTPLVLKIGHLVEPEAAEALVRAAAPFANALAMTNTVASTVIGLDGQPMFDAQRRGIAGQATRRAAVRQIELFSEFACRHAPAVQLIGVGGISTADHVRQFLSSGAQAVHLATAAMIDPTVGLEIRHDLLNGSDGQTAAINLRSVALKS